MLGRVGIRTGSGRYQLGNGAVDTRQVVANDPLVGIGVLGPMVVGDDASLSPRDRVVLAALVVRHGAVVSAETIADALWSDGTPPASWNKVVQGCVMRLRRVLGASAIETHPTGYRLCVPHDEVDAGRFERLVARARDLLSLGEPDRASFALDEALRLWRGRAFSDLEDWEAGQIEAARLDALRLDAEELQLEAAVRAGRSREILADAQARVAQAPLREHRWMLLALAQHQVGRQGEALRTLHQARQLLARELGLDPGADLVALESAILRQDPALTTARLPDASASCPYRGLTAYDVNDADAFHGREPEIGECLERLRRDGVLVVVGPSGSGKSSLVRAGVAAALLRDRRRVAVITPGASPIRTLASTIGSGDAVALVVDQCEEAVTLCPDPDERARFFNALAAHAATAPLVVGLRADRLGELAAFPGFASLVERGLYLLTAMDAARLRLAIELPARQAGLLIEPGLVDLLVHEVEGEPGSLPLLSHALAQTWERREGQTLTVAGYHASGGIRGAVAQTAERVYDRVPSAQRPMLRDLMLRLVSSSPDGEPLRWRLPRRIAAPDADRVKLVEALTEARLVTSDAESVELAHESLARAWPRLREWLDDDVEGQRIWRHLASAAETWDEMGRPDSELYRGVRLARVLDWYDDTSHTLNPTEREFLDAAERLADVERTAAADEARRTTRTSRRLRALAASVTVLALVATAVGLLAAREARRADDEARAARTHELAASAIGALREDPSLAKLLAVTAARHGPPSVAVDAALHEAYAADLSVARWGFSGEVGVLSTALDPSGERLAAAGMFQGDGVGWTVQVVDPYTDELVWSVDVGESGAASAFVADPRFADDGSRVVAGVYWDPDSWRRVPVPFDGVDEPRPELLGAHVWDAATGEVIERFDLGRCGGVVNSVSSTHVLARTLHGSPGILDRCAWREGTVGVELVDRRTGERQVLTTSTGPGWSWGERGAAMSADGRVVAYDDAATGQVVVIDVTSGSTVARLTAEGLLDVNADGSLALVGRDPVEVMDVATGSRVATLDGHRGRVFDARFGPAGRTVYSVGDDGTLREWDAATGRELFAHADAGTGPIAVGADGLIAVSTHDQQYVTVIDRDRRGELGSIATCVGAPVADTLDLAGGVVVLHHRCDGDETSIVVADLGSGAASTTDVDRAAGGIALSPDGSRIVDQALAGDEVGALSVRSTDGRDQLVQFDPLPRERWPFALRVRWSYDGRLVAAALQDWIGVWDAASGELLHVARTGADDVVFDVLFTLDSAALLATTSDRRITRRTFADWDRPTTTEVFVEGSYRMGLVGFAGDGSLLVVGAFQANAASTLAWYDPVTLDQRRLRQHLHEGTVTSAALNDDATLLATAATDGSVRVWDTATAALVHDVPGDGRPVLGVEFDGPHRLLLAPDGGGLELVTTDSAQLLELVTSSLTRGFTELDCQRFEFGDDCPTIGELLPEPPGADALAGTFEVTRTAGGIVDALTQAVIDRYGSAPTPGSFDDLAAEIAGTYTIVLDGGRFDVRRSGTEEPVCVGSVVVRDDHVWLRSERGECYPVKFLDADVDVSDHELRFDPVRIRTEFPWWVALASGPLRRVD